MSEARLRKTGIHERLLSLSGFGVRALVLGYSYLLGKFTFYRRRRISRIALLL